MGEIDPKNKALLDTPLLPDPDKVRVRVYETDSVHKSMSALRQGSIVVVADQDFHKVEPMFKEAVFTHTSTSPNLQIIATLDLARRQMELEGYELVQRATQLAIELRRDINSHPLISKYFRAATPAEMIPAEYRRSGFTDFGAPGWTLDKTMGALENDEFFLDPTRVTLLCGNAAYDGSQFKALLATEHDIQINKTSRNSVLVQININNTKSDVAHLMKALADMAREIDKRPGRGRGARARGLQGARAVAGLGRARPAQLHALPRRVPREPEVARRTRATCARRSTSPPIAAACEHLKLNSKELDERLKNGPELVSAKFVIPYPPGFPIMVPGQVVSEETITFMRKLDVKEIHGYNAALGLELLKPDALAQLKGKAPAAGERAPNKSTLVGA